jgi:superfamily I DNA/RNA helicase
VKIDENLNKDMMQPLLAGSTESMSRGECEGQEKKKGELYASKQTYDNTTNSVTIATIHSVKGLDFSCVFMIGLDYLEPKGSTEDQVNNLVYVGMTRARYQLFIPYIRNSSVIEKLQFCI